MGLEQVKSEVIKKAEKQAATFEIEGQAEADRITSEIKEKISEQKKEIEKTSKEEAEQLIRREVAAAELEQKKKEMDARKILVDSVFSQAYQTIISDSKARSDRVKSLCKKAQEEIEVQTVSCSEKDTKFIIGFKVEEAEIDGGIIAENAEGTILVNYSYESLFDDVKKNTIQEVTKVLFK